MRVTGDVSMPLLGHSVARCLCERAAPGSAPSNAAPAVGPRDPAVGSRERRHSRRPSRDLLHEMRLYEFQRTRCCGDDARPK
jgi:hypothetical protein